MCDYSLQMVKSRPAQVGDKLVTKAFGTGTTGFADVNDCGTAVCVKPGTEIGFDDNIVAFQSNNGERNGKVAIFRQINVNQPLMHHDAIELPDGETLLITYMPPGQQATVLQLPAAPKTAEEAKEQDRLPVTA